MFRRLSTQVTLILFALAVAVVAFGVYFLVSLANLATDARAIKTVALAVETPESRTFVERRFQELDEEAVSAERLITIAVALTVMFILGAIFNVVLIFRHSSRLVLDGIERFRRGDLRYRIPLASKSEFGTIAAYLNEAMSQLAKSQQRRAEAERRLRLANETLESRVEERTRQVVASEARFKHLVENISDVVAVVDARGTVRYLSASIEGLIGYKPEELVGKSLFKQVHPEDAAAAKRVFVARAKKHGFAQAIELRLKHKDGSWRLIEAVSNNLLADPDIRGFVVTAKDVTQRKRAEEQLRELDDLKNAFIRTVSHQLRTPLNAVRWNLESLLAGDMGVLREGQRDLLRVTHDADVEVVRRIDDLLTAMDIEEGRVVVRKTRSGFQTLAESVTTDLRKRADAKDIRLEYHAPQRPLPQVPMDAEKIRVAMEHLVNNAVSYTRDGGRVAVSVSRPDSSVRFEVRDNGIGIPKDEKKRVFTRFFRATNAPQMKPDSSGLGLSLARYFVEQHGGEIGFSSEEGKGSTFWFEIPAK